MRAPADAARMQLWPLPESHPLYLHFLDRELARSVDAQFDRELSAERVVFASLVTTGTLYSSAAFVWESGILDSELWPVIRTLVMSAQLLLISNSETIDSFVADRQAIYYFDRPRYPMYFGRKPDKRLLARPTVRKFSSTTRQLELDLTDLVEGDIGPLSIVSASDARVVGGSREAIRRALGSRDERAITMSLFRNPSDHGSDFQNRPIGRLLAMLHLRQYLRLTGADIVTGLSGIEYFDRLAINYPLLDARYQATVLDLIGMGREVRLRRASDLVRLRSGPDHLVLLSSMARLIAGADAWLSHAVPGASPVERPQLLRRLAPGSHFPSLVDADAAGLYRAAASRLAQLAASLRSAEPTLGEAMRMNDGIAGRRLTRTLLLVATDTERTVVLRAFKAATGAEATRLPEAFHTIYHLGVIGGSEVVMGQSEAGTESPGGMTLTASDLVTTCNPDYLVAVGIAFGLRPDKQKIGEILVSTQLRMMDPRKLVGSKTRETEILRGDKVAPSVTLLDRCHAAHSDWTGVTLHFGLLLSANTLVNSVRETDRLRRLEPDAIGGEMEGGGIYAVGAKRRVDWILIKGIADWGFGKTDESQYSAAENAVAFTLKLLRDGGLARPPGI